MLCGSGGDSGSARTPRAQGRPGSGTAGTAPAPSGSPPIRERRHPVAAGDRASLNRKRRMRKNRTTEQNLKKGGATATAQVASQGRGVTLTDLPANRGTETPPFGAFADPEEPPVRNDTGEPPATSSQAPAAAGNNSREATKTPAATLRTNGGQAREGRLSGLRQAFPCTRAPSSPERPPRMTPAGAVPPMQTC